MRGYTVYMVGRERVVLLEGVEAWVSIVRLL
jgi:hypothetical protein